MQAPRPVISQIVFQESVISRITFINDSKFDPISIETACCHLPSWFLGSGIILEHDLNGFLENSSRSLTWWMSFPEIGLTRKTGVSGKRTTWGCLFGRFRLKSFSFLKSLLSISVPFVACVLFVSTSDSSLELSSFVALNSWYVDVPLPVAAPISHLIRGEHRFAIGLEEFLNMFYSVNRKRSNLKWTYLGWDCVAGAISVIKHWS